MQGETQCACESASNKIVVQQSEINGGNRGKVGPGEKIPKPS